MGITALTQCRQAGLTEDFTEELWDDCIPAWAGCGTRHCAISMVLATEAEAVLVSKLFFQ